jgi:hypothetical protein
MQRNHIATEDLLEYAEGRLETAAAARVRGHLEAGCERCARELALWQRSLVALQADRQPGPPEWVVRRAVTLGLQLEPTPTLWQRVVANLAFDSRLQPALAGARDLNVASFQLLYEAEGTDVDLFCEPAPTGWQLTGQALPAEGAGGSWTVLTRGPEGEREVAADSLGIFRLEVLSPGTYELTLRGGEREIVLENVELA